VPALTTLSASSLLPVTIERGEGPKLFDSEGRAYWDFYGGHAVALLGQGHPRWVEALTRQARTLSFVSTLAPVAIRDQAIEALCRFTRADRAFLVNSGAEANEAALKVARKATGRTEIIAMERGFHGRTMACLGITDAGSYRSQHAPVHGDASFVPYGDLPALERALSELTAAVIIEPIQGIAGVIEPPDGYLTAARALCDGAGALLILDEIQTGIGRTGRAMAWHSEPGCAPDLVTVGKSLGAGFPVAALLLTEAMASTTAPGEHGSTFGGAPMAAAVVLAVLAIIEEEDLLARATSLGELARATRVSGVEAIRGQGCLLGLVLDRPAKPVADALVEQGFLCGTAGDPNCLRLCPPATMPPAALSELLICLAEILEK
jgi:acetylornithine/succinyldiaminopimelate/putrescine aminotransferase